MNWSDLAHFLTLARAGSLRAAAHELGVAPTTVGRRVRALEESLGTALFVRTLHGFTPTDTGLSLAATGREIEERITSLQRQLAPAQGRISGRLCISASELIAADILAPALPAILARFPDLRVQLRVDAHVVSFARNDVDIAIRLMRPKEKRLIARRVGRFEAGLFASRAYLARTGARELAQHRFVAYDDSYGSTLAENLWLKRIGCDGAVALRSGSTRALLEATRAGAGVGVLPKYLARRFADLVALDLPTPIPPRFMYLVTHEELRKRPAVRAVWDALFSTLSQVDSVPGGRMQS